MEKYLNKLDEISETLLGNNPLIANEQVQQLKKTIIYDMAMKNANCYKKEQLRCAKQVLKSASKKVPNKLFHNIFKVDDTYQLTDGYIAIVLKDMINGLELSTLQGNFDGRKIIESINPTGYEYKKTEIDMMELEQKAIMAKKEPENLIPLEDTIHINNLYYYPIHLLRAIRILGTKDIEMFAHISGKKEPLYLKSEFGEAIVLPIRQAEKNIKE